jgi:hypothetical protein
MSSRQKKCRCEKRVGDEIREIGREEVREERTERCRSGRPCESIPWDLSACEFALRRS